MSQEVPRRRRIIDKWLLSLLQSKRVMAAIASLMVGVLGPYFAGLDEGLALAIVAQLVAWLVSDSVRPSDNVFTSRRFWTVIAGSVATLAANYGITLDAEVITSIAAAISAWILGDGLRPTITPREGKGDQGLRFRALR